MNCYIVNPLYIDENLLNENEICHMYQVTPLRIKSYSIFNDENDKNYLNNKNDQEFKKIIKKHISDIPLLISKKNNDENNPIKIKRYFKIDLLKNELIQIKKKSFLIRKNIVEDNIKHFQSIIGINEKYIFLLKLLLHDNTNKNLLILYLTFLKENENELETIFNGNIEKYDTELKYYSKVFNGEENKRFFKAERKGQKYELIIFLNNILSLNENNSVDIQKFENYLNECNNSFENISYFNMPIDFSNEELFYYRNINLIKYYLKNLYIEIKKNIENEEKNSVENNEKENYEVLTTEIKINSEKEKQKLLKLELKKIKSNIKLCINDINNE